VEKIRARVALWFLCSLVSVPISGAAAGTPQTQPAAPTDAGEQSSNSSANHDPEAMLPHFHSTRFWLSGQANFIFQAHPGFHAPYSGQNSLSPRYEKATSRVLTLYAGGAAERFH